MMQLGTPLHFPLPRVRQRRLDRRVKQAERLLSGAPGHEPTAAVVRLHAGVPGLVGRLQVEPHAVHLRHHHRRDGHLRHRRRGPRFRFPQPDLHDLAWPRAERHREFKRADRSGHPYLVVGVCAERHRHDDTTRRRFRGRRRGQCRSGAGGAGAGAGGGAGAGAGAGASKSMALPGRLPTWRGAVARDGVLVARLSVPSYGGSELQKRAVRKASTFSGSLRVSLSPRPRTAARRSGARRGGSAASASGSPAWAPASAAPAPSWRQAAATSCAPCTAAAEPAPTVLPDAISALRPWRPSSICLMRFASCRAHGAVRQSCPPAARRRA